MKRNILLLRSLLLFVQPFLTLVQANINTDYVDYSFECPLKAVCPQICVPTPFHCPVSMQCPGNTTLCADGSCAEICSPDLVSPCTESCAPIACPLVIGYFEECLSLYSAEIEFAENCAALDGLDDTMDEEAAGSQFSWTDPSYIAGYVWVGGVTIAIIVWCRFNHYVVPLKAGTKVLQMQIDEEENDDSIAYQSGFKRHPVGMILFRMTQSVYVLWAGGLLLISYLRAKHGDNLEDKVMLFKTMAVIWNVGIVWCLAMLWPHSVESLFLRKCPLEEATHVSIYLRNSQLSSQPADPSRSNSLMTIQKRLAAGLRKVMCLIFADPNLRPNKEEGILQYCPVQCNPDGSRYFVFLFRRYNFDDTQKIFIQGKWSVGKTFREIAPESMHKVYNFEFKYENATREEPAKETKAVDVFDKLNCLFAEGLSSEDVKERQNIVGKNTIDMPKPNYFRGVCDELSKPFYIYQFFILLMWLSPSYWYMSISLWCIIVMTACLVAWFRFSGAWVLYGISDVSGIAMVMRDDRAVNVPQSELVPGDIVGLSTGLCHCDLVLLDGEVLVDESVLTGEATPQSKAPIDPMSNDVYNPQNHRKHTISAGTKILECEGSLGLVVNTASFTTKGRLLRDTIAFRHYVPQHEKELPIAIAILVVWSICLSLYSTFNSSDIPIFGWLYGMITFSNAFPAVLPIAFSFPIGISFNRLARSGIACANSDSILIAGRVCRAFFDKTGTLTKEGLDYISCRSAESWESGQWTSRELDTAMATCHSVIRTNSGALIGNPVDRAMFAASQAQLQMVTGTTVRIRDREGNDLTVLRRFDFDHNTMTQSVVVRLNDGTLKVFVKGSGESVIKRCDKESIPTTFDEKLRQCSRIGIYQIAVASKVLPKETTISTLSRKDAESNLSFAGVLNFSNTMREETPAVIRQLLEANIQSIMLTGDNIFTGIHIARASSLLKKTDEVILGQLNTEGNIEWTNENSERVSAPTLLELKNGSCSQTLAMSGAAWCKLLNTDRMRAISLVPFVRVFARCSPTDKVSVVDTFRALGDTTIMCGDGGNDCGALKAAHVGLALSDSDASIVSPFTSLARDITAVLALLKEGRAALASTMSTYKFLIMYAQISSYNQVVLYKFAVTLSDWMWTFIDGVWTVAFSLALPLALPALKLSPTRPTGSLLGWDTVGSIVGMVGLDFVFMAIALVTLYDEEWFQCRKWDLSSLPVNAMGSASDNYETEVIFLVSSIQMLGAAIVFNIGYEFRRNWFRNWAFVVLAVAFTTIMVYVTLVPSPLSCVFRTNCANEDVVRSVLDPEPQPIGNYYGTTVMPMSFRIKLVFILLGNIAAIAAFDYLVVNGLRRRWARQDLMESSVTPTRLVSSVKMDETRRSRTAQNFRV